MDIITRGEAMRFFKPEEVSINLTFINKNNKYDNVLEEGLENVQVFLNDVLKKLDFTKEDLKTNSFNISEQTIYDPELRKSKFDGYQFRQTAHIKFDYDIKKMTKFMELVSLLKNPVYYALKFNVKDVEKCKNLVIKDAYNAAENKAKAIAEASGKKIKECIKIDFKAFSEQVISNSSLESINQFGNRESEIMSKKSMSRQETNIIENTFTPEDVIIKEELYCLWLAE